MKNTFQVFDPDQGIEITVTDFSSVAAVASSTLAQAKRMYAAVEDRDVDFFDYRPVCKTCFGSGWAVIYRNGQRRSTRCPGWVWIPGDKPNTGHGECRGNEDWLDWEKANKQNLQDYIFDVLLKTEANEEQFRGWLTKQFNVDWIDRLIIEQLELIVVKVDQMLNQHLQSAQGRRFVSTKRQSPAA